MGSRRRTEYLLVEGITTAQTWGFCHYCSIFSTDWLYNSEPQSVALAWSFSSNGMENVDMTCVPSSKCSDLMEIRTRLLE